jgi:AraC family transcriptional regulator, regulatory protein of adaptative response / methylated-DNA-[protein]-cysteine methyltransferase
VWRLPPQEKILGMTMSSSTQTVKVPSVFAGKAWQQVLARDARADGQFFYAVKTTKVFCKPSCPSRRPERKNVTFFPTVEQAQAAGYRACLRCEPESVARKPDPQSAAIEAAATYLTEHASERTKLKDLSAATGVAPLTILRGFKRVLGVTPREYAKAQRVARFKEKVREPKLSITDAIYEAGFGSSSRAYEGSPMGMTPSAMKAGGKGEIIRYTMADSPLGRLLVAATSRGVCSVALADSDDELKAELQQSFPHAELKRMDAELTREVSAVISLLGENPAAVALPLDVRMTAFQQRVWSALLTIPRGTLKTYGELAAEIGSPKAAMAVGQALGKNPLALLVPCHRVVGSDRSMTGWRWGTERKQRLLQLEGAR